MGLIRLSITFSNNFPNTGKRLIGLYEEGSFFGLLSLYISNLVCCQRERARRFSIIRIFMLRGKSYGFVFGGFFFLD